MVNYMEKLNIPNMSVNELSSYIGKVVQANLMTREEMGRSLKYILELFQMKLKKRR